MTDILLTIHCSPADAEALIDVIRIVTHVPLHVHAETVHGRDFSDARTAEKVTATLKRSAIEVIETAAAVEEILQSIDAAKRRFPVRWHQTPVTARGRFS